MPETTNRKKNHRMAHSRQLAIVLAFITGCAEMPESPQGEPVFADPPVTDAPLAATRSAAAVEFEAAPVAPSPPAKVERPAAGSSPSVLAPAKAAPAAVPVPEAKAPPRTHDDPVAAIAPVASSLDMVALKARLRETAAIGVLAKISLSKQMDELLESFRAHYDGGQTTSLAALRKPYDELVMKVIDLLHERDPSLARSISNSREAIWQILADRERFRLMH
jgi:hypothetical protein